MSAEDIAAEYEELVKEIREKTPSTKLYLQSVMPIDNSFDRYKNLIGREGVIPPLNEKIRNIAAENGAVYIDLWPALADPNTGSIKKEYTNDGLHLTGAGYLAWVKLIRPYVMED
jgi:lysophospholipase L1-like esterase